MYSAAHETLDWPEILNKLTNLATSELGREQLSRLSPLSDQASCTQSFHQILETQTLLNSSGVRPFMESLSLFSLWSQRLEKNATLKTLELKDARHFFIEVDQLWSELENPETPFLQTQKGSLFDPQEPLSAIDQIMTPDGSIRSDASETLFKLTREKNQKAQEISKILDRLVKEHELEAVLQDKYVTTREGRWVLPVKSGMQGQFDGIIHASSQSKQTVFMEPKEVVKTNNRLREIESEIEQEIELLLKGLSAYLQGRHSEIKLAFQVLLEMDQTYAKAQMSNLLSAQEIQFAENEIILKHLRHPLLVLDDQVEVTPNSVKLDPQNRILLLSGPNAGGKTILLKSIGLAVQMARCGLLVCAEPGSKIPYFKNLHIGIGDSQSVDAHLSTFAAHLQILDSAAQFNGFENLILIDEICGSTDPEEGTALARSFIHEFCENKVFAIITSHLGPLKTGWKKDFGVINGSLEYNNDTGQPTYQFISGIPGQSLAIQTAKRVGVIQKIVARALDFLSPEMKKYLSSLDELEDQKAELRKLKQEVEAQRKELSREKSKYHALAQKFEKDKSNMLNTVVKRAEKKIDKMVGFSKVDNIFKKHSSSQSLKNQLPQVVKVSQNSGQASFTNVEEFENNFPAGSKVFSPSLGKDGIVQGPANGKGEIPILAQSMRLLVHWSELVAASLPTSNAGRVIRTPSTTHAVPASGDRFVDLRGFKVQEALDQLEKELDQAASTQSDRVKIIHGHGTDTLKRAIRSYLSRSLYVKKWNSGAQLTGGDGITWVELKD